MKHVKVNNANIEPVFFAFPDNGPLEKVIREVTAGEPEYAFTAPDGFGHYFWVVTDPAHTTTITEEFAAMPHLYIADGHHRSAAAARVGLEKAAADRTTPARRNTTISLPWLSPHRTCASSTTTAW